MRACFHFSYLRGSSNMATSKAKTIDDIDDFKEMLEVMTALEISSGGLKTLDEMKSRVKSELEQLPNIPSWTAGQVNVLYIEKSLYNFLERCFSSQIV